MFSIEIEATNECNTRCYHCPHEAITRPKGMMDWSTYKAIVDKVRTHNQRDQVFVQYAGMGEPLLHPLIFQFVEFISAWAVTSITTNASALTKKNIVSLAQAGLDQLMISFNGSDRETYELMMGGLAFDRAAQYLQSAVELTQGQRMNVAANISVTKQTKTHLQEIKKFLNSMGIETILFSQCHNRGGYLKGTTVCDTPLPPGPGEGRCDIFTGAIFVAWTGDILSCCHDLSGVNYYGNLITDDIQDILSRQESIAQASVNFSICKRCNDLYRFKNDPTPGRVPLSDWIYHLHADEAQGTKWLSEQKMELAAHCARNDQTISKLDSQIKHWRDVWDGHQQGIGWKLWLKFHFLNGREVPVALKQLQILRCKPLLPETIAQITENNDILAPSAKDSGARVSSLARCASSLRIGQTLASPSIIAQWIEMLFSEKYQNISFYLQEMESFTSHLDRQEQVINSLKEELHQWEINWHDLQNDPNLALWNSWRSTRMQIIPPGSRRERLVNCLLGRRSFKYDSSKLAK